MTVGAQSVGEECCSGSVTKARSRCKGREEVRRRVRRETGLLPRVVRRSSCKLPKILAVRLTSAADY